jgi:acyl-coenzyme A synthetase/AMP-(fatty) acid ligase
MTITDQPSGVKFPSAVTHIADHTANRPNDIAVVVNGNEISYWAFYRDIGCVVTALRKLGLKPGQIAGVEHPHLYLHWLAVLALETLGVTSFSYGKSDIATLREELCNADFLLCTPEGVPDGPPPHQLLDQSWIEHVRRELPENPIQTFRLAPDTPLRITRSSGTTGSLKRMFHTARIREFWIHSYLVCAGVTRRSRCLMGVGFTIEAMHYYATACIRMGGTCIIEGRTDMATVLAKQDISHVSLPTYILKQLLDGLPVGYEKPPKLSIYLISAAVPQEMRTRIQQKLADKILESYGTSESGGICDMDGTGIGTLRPGVLVDVIDEHDNPVTGEIGRIRVKSNGVVSGYIGDPDSTARMFADEWFYPGDLAIKKDEQTLQLIGRADDLFNIGGVKFAPGPLEERLRQSVTVEDLCLAELHDRAGLSRLCVVIVPSNESNTEDLQSKLSPLLPTNLGTIELVMANHIPRTEMGKAKRNELVQALQNRAAG